jgi:hypothetical protein
LRELIAQHTYSESDSAGIVCIYKKYCIRFKGMHFEYNIIFTIWCKILLLDLSNKSSVVAFAR